MAYERQIPSFRRGRWAHSSAVECLLCKEDAQGSNPCGSMSPPSREFKTSPLRACRELVVMEDDRCTNPREGGWEGFDEHARKTSEVSDDDRVYVRSRRPLNPLPGTWTYYTGYCASW
jgi:hypothetical protein